MQEAWIKVVGFPLHLWKPKILKKIVNACGGFTAIDKITELRTEVKWARILIKTTGKSRPSVVNILEGPRSFELQIWWEIPPWVAEVYPVRSRAATKNLNEEEDEAARADMRVGIIRPSNNDDRQKGKAWGSNFGRQSGLVEAESGNVKSVHLMKLRGGAHADDWENKKAGSRRLGCGMIQQARSSIGPTDRAGITIGLNGLHLLGPKLDPVRRPKAQKAKCG